MGICNDMVNISEHSLGRRLFWSVLSLFVFFAVCFIVFQQKREKEYKTDMLNQRLQDFNVRMNEALTLTGAATDRDIDRYVAAHRLPGMRLTIIDPHGRVVYDNERKDYANIPNHRDRQEVSEALRQGRGYDISRSSHTLTGDFFYSATYFPPQRRVIRSAMPYNNDLAQAIQTDLHFIWFALTVLLLLSFVLYRFTLRLSTNVNNLRLFAQRADLNEPLQVEDLARFPNDELGEISEYIIKLYQRLQRTKEEQNVLKRQLTQNIAHELKTPVASIQGYLETVLENKDINDDTRQLFLTRCHAQSQRLASLLADISTLNRLDDAPELTHFEEVDIAATVSQIAEETALSIRQRRMTFDNRLPQNIRVKGNPSLIYSIFRNLTDNAIAYAGEGTTITLSATESDKGDQWLFSFADNGVGVGEEHLGRLFERFYRVDKGRSRKLGGTGLGLAIVKNAVLLHGGQIKASANKGGGLLFSFSIHK